VGARTGPHPRGAGQTSRPHPGLSDLRRRHLALLPTRPRAGARGAAGDVEPDWISGFALAERSSRLLHDCQYTDEEYSERVGWGHSRLSDALLFARRSEAERVVLFHHDPLHTDEDLDELHRRAGLHWRDLGGPDGGPGMAIEGTEIELLANGATAGADTGYARARSSSASRPA
jgi:hypothetical protein